jgi:hypothetical protein
VILKYHRTEVMITSGEDFRFRNNGGRRTSFAHATRSVVATLPQILLTTGLVLLDICCKIGRGPLAPAMSPNGISYLVASVVGHENRRRLRWTGGPIRALNGDCVCSAVAGVNPLGPQAHREIAGVAREDPVRIAVDGFVAGYREDLAGDCSAPVCSVGTDQDG